ncbi:MAG TPA: DUF805 domain-containing protein [Pyrinomonadaceae bacterium]|jgi:uncharacterized membrane protein YhaH (DUF805 family)|nr:DUF805 domain-containing protein [Pyrinomonadaceae bacterium]
MLDLWSWQGRVGRGHYLATGLILFFVKHNIDRVLAALAGYPWSPVSYWIFMAPNGVASLNPVDAMFYVVLVLFALPFMWMGTVLTLRRLRDADLPLWLVMLFFVPFLNVIFFFILVAIPSREQVDDGPKLGSPIGRFIPQSEFGSAIFGAGLTAILAVVETVFSTTGLGKYGWGLFVGIPFFLGLNSTMIYGFHYSRSLGRCLLVSLLSIGLVGLGLVGFAIEGIICLAMALPLAIPLALFGGLIGYVLQKREYPTNTLRVASVVCLIVPGLILIEYGLGETPPLYEVKTSVVIKSDLQTVWTHVVTFSQLPPPTEAMFKTGIAYPIRAEMHGHGVGAERHCVFSTGAFVEPITVWDEPRLLAFGVSGQPPAMEEMSIYRNLHPPHLDNYFVAKRGQFELKPLPDGTTLLEGTTWYQNRYWPAPYWHLWSDHVIETIHNRVLLHIKSLAEQQSQRAQN